MLLTIVIVLGEDVLLSVALLNGGHIGREKRGRRRRSNVP